MRAASAFAVAFGLGLALGLILTSPAGTGGGQYWIFVIIAACTYVGWLAARLSSTFVSLVVGPVLVLAMTAVLFGVKLVRMPDAPLTGDGIEMSAIPLTLGSLIAP